MGQVGCVATTYSTGLDELASITKRQIERPPPLSYTYCTSGAIMRNGQQQHSAPVGNGPIFFFVCLVCFSIPPRSLCGVTQHVHGCFTKGSDRDGHREEGACLCLDDLMHKQATGLKLLVSQYSTTRSYKYATPALPSY